MLVHEWEILPTPAPTQKNRFPHNPTQTENKLFDWNHVEDNQPLPDPDCI
jgi:hypothetical protein